MMQIGETVTINEVKWVCVKIKDSKKFKSCLLWNKDGEQMIMTETNNG